MTWNYRVISHPSWDFAGDKGAREYRIHEVFSDETGIIGYSANGCEPFGETKKDLMVDLSYMEKLLKSQCSMWKIYPQLSLKSIIRVRIYSQRVFDF